MKEGAIFRLFSSYGAVRIRTVKLIAVAFIAFAVAWESASAGDVANSLAVPISQAQWELQYVRTLSAPNQLSVNGRYQSGTSRLAWSQDGERLAVYVNNGLDILTWSLDGTYQFQFPRHTRFGLDSYVLGFLSGHSQIIVSPAANTKNLDDEKSTEAMAFSVVDAATGSVLRGVAGPNPGKTFRENIVRHFSISSDQKLIAVIYHPNAGRSIGIYSTDSWERIGAIDLSLNNRTPDPQAVAFSHDGTKLAVARGDNGHVDVFEVGSWRLMRSINAFPEAPPPMYVLLLGAISFSPDGSMIAVAAGSGGAYRKYSDGSPAPIGKGSVIDEFPADPLRVFRVDDGSLIDSARGFPAGFRVPFLGSVNPSPLGDGMRSIRCDANVEIGKSYDMGL